MAGCRWHQRRAEDTTAVTPTAIFCIATLAGGVQIRRVTLICVGCTDVPVPSHMTVFRREVSHSRIASQALVASCPHTDTARAPDRACPHPPPSAPFGSDADQASSEAMAWSAFQM
jgi:hypothetical protein